MQKQANKRETTIIAGKSTFGKSWYVDEYLYNYNRVIILDPLLEHDGKSIYGPEGIRRHIAGNPIYRIKTECLMAFEDLCRVILANGQPDRRIMFCIEEISRLLLDAQLKRYPSFRQIVYAGGHSGIDLCIVAQRISTIPIACRSQYTKIITFCQTEPADLEYLKSVSQEAVMGEIPTLKPREYIKITNTTVEKLKS